ncbi:hypothetical protein O3M35_004292 [Rhynocoris fuscipes]|uniref:Apoptosis inhibitor 5 n=1 Tax=Rhynocoris fuscipes TaxID=488301 RepID=A0AAW1CFW4_9HEMI
MEFLDESEKVNKLYTCYGVLVEADQDQIKEHQPYYEIILNAVKGSAKEKRLASQFIPVFFKHFPELSDAAIEAIFDLCEDPDQSIRKYAFKELPVLCRDCPSQTKKVASVLSQLLVVQDLSELRIIHTALLALFKIDATATIHGICTQVRVGDDSVRNFCLRFLSVKMRNIVKEIKDADAEDALLAEIKNLLEDCAVEEIPLLMKIALSTGKWHSLSGKYELANMIADNIEADIPFDPTRNESIERLILLLRHVHLLQLGVHRVRSNRFVIYVCEQVLPRLREIPGCSDGTGYTLEILQLLADITRCVEEINYCGKAVNSLFETLTDFLPNPLNDISPSEQIHFSYIECILYTFHRLVKFNRSLFDDNPGKLKYLRHSLKHFARTVNGHVKILGKYLNEFGVEGLTENSDVNNENFSRKWPLAVKHAIQNNCKDSFLSMIESRQVIKWKAIPEGSSITSKYASIIENAPDYERIRFMPEIKKNCYRALAYDACQNILLLIKDFFKNPLTFDLQIQLSFFAPLRHETNKTIQSTANVETNTLTNGAVNSTSDVEDINRSQHSAIRPNLALYVPPSGKYSANFRR